MAGITACVEFRDRPKYRGRWWIHLNDHLDTAKLFTIDKSKVKLRCVALLKIEDWKLKTNPDILNALSELIPNESQRVSAAQLLQGFLGTSSDVVQGGDVAADVDLDRASRCGFPEVVYGEGKPAALIVEILRRQHEAGQRGFVTRLDTEQAALICAEFPDAIHNPAARTVASAGYPLAAEVAGSVAVVSAGSCDAPVAQEALETLRWMGIDCQLIEDVGVAGPTSVGYGASLGGITALLSMLSSCASNVVTVNIDAGFRGGYAAGLIARQAVRQKE
jgi:NCAIR mutase (PurE)-related protein